LHNSHIIILNQYNPALVTIQSNHGKCVNYVNLFDNYVTIDHRNKYYFILGITAAV
jgi:hypothetical protein